MVCLHSSHLVQSPSVRTVRSPMGTIGVLPFLNHAIRGSPARNKKRMIAQREKESQRREECTVESAMHSGKSPWGTRCAWQAAHHTSFFQEGRRPVLRQRSERFAKAKLFLVRVRLRGCAVQGSNSQ